MFPFFYTNFTKYNFSFDLQFKSIDRFGFFSTHRMDTLAHTVQWRGEIIEMDSQYRFQIALQAIYIQAANEKSK